MVRTSISFTPQLLRSVDRAAKRAGVSRSAWTRRACVEALESQDALSRVLQNDAIRTAMARVLGDPSVVRGFASQISEELSDDQLRLFSEQLREVLSGD